MSRIGRIVSNIACPCSGETVLKVMDNGTLHCDRCGASFAMPQVPLIEILPVTDESKVIKKRKANEEYRSDGPLAQIFKRRQEKWLEAFFEFSP